MISVFASLIAITLCGSPLENCVRGHCPLVDPW